MSGVRAQLQLVLCGVWLASCARDVTPAAAAACSAVEQCGGDVQGTWHVDACYLSVQQPQVQGCEAASTSAEALEPMGRVIFEDTTYTFDFSLTMRIHIQLPETCRHAAGMSFECAELGGTLARGETLQCSTLEGGACDCSADLSITGDDVGPYSAHDERLSLRAEPFDYCVQSDRLLLNHRIAVEMDAPEPMITLLQLTLMKR